MMQFDHCAPVTQHNVAQYLSSSDLTGESAASRVAAVLCSPAHIVYCTARLIVHVVQRLKLGLALTMVKDARALERAILKSKVDLWQDRRALSGVIQSLFWPSVGRAQVIVSEINRREFTQLIVTSDSCVVAIEELRKHVNTLDSYDEEAFSANGSGLVMGMLVNEGILPARRELLATGRVQRFRQYYLKRKLDYEEVFRKVKKFLIHDSAVQQLPPIFLNSPLSIDRSVGTSIPSDVQCDYWLMVAYLRVKVDAARDTEQMAQLCKKLREELLREKGEERAQKAMDFFLRWVNPSNESIIFQKAFALPTLELLCHEQSESIIRSHEEIDHERRLQRQVLKIGNNLLAHGISQKRGGMKNLLNVMLEGFLSCKGRGAFTHGREDQCAGSHGPFYVILARESSENLSEDYHLAYIVPGNRDLQLVHRVLNRACEEGFLSFVERDRILVKVLTYQNLLDMPVRNQKGEIDAVRFAKTVRKSF